MGTGSPGLNCGGLSEGEQRVEQVTTGHQGWVFRTPQEKWHKDYILPKNHRQGKLMVWGCFWGSQLGPLVVPLIPANGFIPARFYRSLLRHGLLPVLEDIRHPSAVIRYFNETMLAYALQSSCSPLRAI